MLGRVATALLAGLRKVGRFVRTVDTLIGVGNDRDFQRNRVRKRVGELRIESNADDQDAVYQCRQEQHRRQTVRHDRMHESHLVEGIGVQRNVGHVRANNPSITVRKQATTHTI